MNKRYHFNPSAAVWVFLPSGNLLADLRKACEGMTQRIPSALISHKLFWIVLAFRFLVSEIWDFDT